MNVVIAGGGTGGHVYPAIAVAQALKLKDPNANITFIGTERGIETTAVPKAGFKLILIKVSRIKGMGLWTKIRTILGLPWALVSSMILLKKLHAEAVVGVGGYASGPVVAAAWILRIPTAILEQNSIPGFTNRLLGRLVIKIFGAFKANKDFFHRGLELVGNPLRLDFTNAKWQMKDHTEKQVLVVGGSLGARVFNENLPEAIHLLQEQGIKVRVLHQTGAKDVDFVKQQYTQKGVAADVRAFIEDMPAAYLDADIVICRSGAITCSEITALGVPSIMVPYPYAIYNHQYYNAYDISSQGGSLLVPQSQLTSQKICDILDDVFKHPNKRQEIALHAAQLGKHDAALHIANDILNRFKH